MTEQNPWAEFRLFEIPDDVVLEVTIQITPVPSGRKPSAPRPPHPPVPRAPRPGGDQ